MRLCFETVMRKRNRSIDLEKGKPALYTLIWNESDLVFENLPLQKGGSSLFNAATFIYLLTPAHGCYSIAFESYG